MPKHTPAEHVDFELALHRASGLTHAARTVLDASDLDSDTAAQLGALIDAIADDLEALLPLVEEPALRAV